MPQHKKRLVILSVPFQRLNRVLLSPAVLEPLLAHADIVVVSPFAEDRTFQQEFGQAAIRLLKWMAPDGLQRLPGRLYGVSEILRMNGYWRRYRKQGMAWFLAIAHLKLGMDGNDEVHPVARRVVFYFLSLVGTWPKAWRIIDRLIGSSVLDVAPLRAVARNYEHVTLIQSASWGLQDRMLAWVGRQAKWRTVLVPYTSDQLYFCGYLMSDFDAVCVQGPAEDQFARRFHGISPSRIKHLGSAWFRHMDVIRRHAGEESMGRQSSAPKTIMFAGVSSTSYHKQGQYEVIDELLRAIEDGRLRSVQLILRPVAADESEKAEITNRYGNHRSVQLQWPQATCLGLDRSANTPVRGMEEELSEYIGQLRRIDVVVMAVPTSLAYDAAYLGIPSLTYLSEKSEFSRRRSMDLMIDAEKKFVDFTDLPIVQQLDRLVSSVQELLANPLMSRTLADRAIKEWDYPAADFERILVEAVTGEAC